MSTHHTPGPWRVVRGRSVEIDLSPGMSAECYAGTEANARLIAAAPDLLETLREIAERDWSKAEMRQMAALAIAKATA